LIDRQNLENSLRRSTRSASIFSRVARQNAECNELQRRMDKTKSEIDDLLGEINADIDKILKE